MPIKGTAMSVRLALCPRFDTCDFGCGGRLTLAHLSVLLDETISFCTNDYEACSIYCKAARGLDARVVELTIGGDHVRGDACDSARDARDARDSHGSERDRGADARIRRVAS